MLLQFPLSSDSSKGCALICLPVALLFRNVILVRLARHCCIQIGTGVREHCETAGYEVGDSADRVNVKVISREGK